jgi:hypothetical protein
MQIFRHQKLFLQSAGIVELKLFLGQIFKGGVGNVMINGWMPLSVKLNMKKIFKWLDNMLPWFSLVVTFFIFYGSVHTGEDYKDVIIFLLITGLLFRIRELEKSRKGPSKNGT